MAHQNFSQLILSDEVSRRNRVSAGLSARAARLDPGMRLENWDEQAAISFDRALWSS